MDPIAMPYQFVDSGGTSGLRNLDVRERRLVRSHVIKGKNRHKIRRNTNKNSRQPCDGPVPFLPPRSYCQAIIQPSKPIGSQWLYFQFPFELKPSMQRAVVACECRATEQDDHLRI
jgi:hypothetical protein